MLSGKAIIVAVSPFLTYIATPPPRRSDRSRRKGGWKPAKLIKLDPSGVDEVESHVSVTHNMSMLNNTIAHGVFFARSAPDDRRKSWNFKLRKENSVWNPVV